MVVLLFGNLIGITASHFDHETEGHSRFTMKQILILGKPGKQNDSIDGYLWIIKV